MSVINRIEVSNFLNLDNRKPSEAGWEPHWRHVVINLRGTSAAIVATNGAGKSTLNRALYAILTRDQSMHTETRKRAAPYRKGQFSHIRIEILFRDASTVAAPGLIGMEVPGEAYVLGCYGYSDGDNPLQFYSYRGYLEDCPVCHVEGTRKTLISNADFLQALKNPRLSCFSPQDKKAWQDHVHRHFDPNLLAQLLFYQKAGGGDGAENFFKVRRRPGEDYDAAFFYSHIAPELLVNCMGAYAEEGEHRFEDTMLESARPVIEAEGRCQKKGLELKAINSVFADLTEAKARGDAYREEQGDLARMVGQSRAEAAFLRQIVDEAPIPGIPRPHPSLGSQTATVADQLVVVDGQVWVPDYLLGAILGMEPSRINRDAQERTRLPGKALRGAQVIENPWYLSESSYIRPQIGHAHPNQGYRLQDAISLVRSKTSFAEGWDGDAAQRALNYAVSWREGEGEPNPARAAARRLGQELALLTERIKREEGDLKGLEQERDTLHGAIQAMEAAAYALTEMRRCGLFTVDELANPAAVAATIAASLSNLEQERQALHDRNAELAPARQAYDAVQKAFPSQSPDAVKRRLEDDAETSAAKKEEAELAWERAKATVESAGAAEAALHQEQRHLEGDISVLAPLVPLVEAFDRVFPGEQVAGLQEAILTSHGAAVAAQAKWQVTAEQLTQEADALAKLAEQSAAYEDDFEGESPYGLAVRVTAELSSAKADLDTHQQKRTQLREQQVALMAGAQACEEVARQFGDAIPATQLEQHLQDQLQASRVRLQTLTLAVQERQTMLAALLAFEAEFGTEASPAAVYAKRTHDFEHTSESIRSVESHLQDLSRRRADLEQGNSSATQQAHAALELLGDRSRPLHAEILDYDLPPERREWLLRHFAHLLHAPVLQDPACATTALADLRQQGLEIPVFLRDGLERFCCDFKLTDAGPLTLGLLAGEKTPAVWALIEPAGLEALKASIEGEISANESLLERLRQEYEELHPDSARSQQLQLARQAVTLGARELQIADVEQIGQCEATISGLSTALSPASIDRIRLAARFVATQGEQELARVVTALKAEERYIVDLQLRMPLLERRASPALVELIALRLEFLNRGGPARRADVSQELATAQSELTTLASSLPHLTLRLENLHLVRAAEQFLNAGGFPNWRSLNEKLEAGRGHLEAAQKALNQAREVEQQAGHTLASAQRAATDAQLSLSQWRLILEQAIHFLQEQGPTFIETYTDLLAKNKARQSREADRNKHNFSLAQQAADDERDQSAAAGRQARLDELGREIDGLRTALTDHHDRKEDLIEIQQALTQKAAELDAAIVSILSQYRQAMALMRDLPPELLTTVAGEGENIFLRTARQLLQELASTRPDNVDEAVQLISDIAGNVGEMPLAKMQGSIQSKSKAAKDILRDLHKTLESVRMRHRDQLSIAEFDLLADKLNSLALVDNINKLHRLIESYLLKAEDAHQKATEDVEAAKDRLSDTIEAFSSRVADNFKLLQKSMGRQGPNSAGITIRATIADGISIRSKIQEVITAIRSAESARADQTASGRERESQREYDERLKAEIRDQFYRGVIGAPEGLATSGPIIEMNHPGISGGRTMRMSGEFSTGQANAIALLILVRLADYTLRRDAAASLSDFGYGKARPSGSRVVMIDGLFSNLSNKEMVRHSLGVPDALRSQFQLVGWIHSDEYRNDPELFPTFVVVRRLGKKNGFVLVNDHSNSTGDGVSPIEFHADKLPPMNGLHDG